MAGQFIFTGLFWKNDQPYITYCRIDDTRLEEKSLKVGDKFNIRFRAGKYCIGTEIDRALWISCAENKLRLGKDKKTALLESSKQCDDCLNNNFFTCRMTCTGMFCKPSSPKAKLICKPPNTNVYLTSVAGIKKVGVSLSLPRRWIEQGSDLAVKVAEAPGLEARRIEQRIAEELSLKLQVRNNHKIKNLASKNIEQERSSLMELVSKSMKIIDDNLAETGKRIENPEILEFSESYGENLNGLNILEKKIELNGEFGGEIVAIKGSILVVKQETYYYAIDLKKLISNTFEFIEHDARMDTQTALDEWF